MTSLIALIAITIFTLSSLPGSNGRIRLSEFGGPVRKLSRFPIMARSRKPHNPFAAFLGQHKAGVKGHAIINGEYVETTRILIQRMTPMGVAYYPYGKPNLPVFIRVEKELGKKYVVFQDPYLPPGEGYLVVLKKIPYKANFQVQAMLNQGVQPMIPVPAENYYNAFHLHLSNNIHGNFDRLNVRKFAYGIRTRFSGRRKARRKWLRRRQMRFRNRRRFGLSRWRGKRSAETISAFSDAIKISKLDHCSITRLNITQIRLKAENLELSSLNFTSPITLPGLVDTIEEDDFDY